MTTNLVSPFEAAPTTALVTGANKGIGQQVVRELADRGWTVWLGARDVAAGERARSDIGTTRGPVRVVELDVTSDASVAAAVCTVSAAGGLDVLVNNAGIGGRWVTVEETTPADFLAVYGVNVLGPVRVTQAFLPMLKSSAQPRIVMVSSGMGSLAVTTDPDRFESTLHSLVYPSSKTALNMITTMYAKALTGIRVNAADPGYTATDLNGFRGMQTVQQGAASVVALATAGPDGPTGGFFDAAGPVPW